jgi:Outer membrane protein Omp28
MNKYFTYLLLCMVIFHACKDDEGDAVIGDKQLIDYQSDSSYTTEAKLTPDDRNVLIQEFTGVYCYACSDAHEIVSNLKSQFPGRVVPMNIHSYLFSIYDDPKIMGNKYDFRTVAGDTIVSMLGGIESIPSATFNMTLQDGEVRILSSERTQWEAYFHKELAKDSKVNIKVSTKFNSTTRNLKIVTRYTVLEPLSGSLNYTTAIIENDIIDKQFVDSVVVDDYNHTYILRDVVSSDAKGTLLSENASRGDVFIVVQHFIIPEEWNDKNLNIVTYAHDNTDNYIVYQANLNEL